MPPEVLTAAHNLSQGDMKGIHLNARACMKSHAGLYLSIAAVLIGSLSLSCGLGAFSYEKFALFDAAAYLSLVGLVMGIVAVGISLRGAKDRNVLIYAVLGVLLSSPLVGFAAMARVTTTTRREFEKAYTLKDSMRLLYKTIQSYTETHDGRLPDAGTWFESLVQVNSSLGHAALRHPRRHEITIVYNANLAGLRISDIRQDVVLFFEGEGGPNLAGGPELLPPSSTTPTIDVVFLDGTIHTYWVERQGIRAYDNEFLPVRWKP